MKEAIPLSNRLAYETSPYLLQHKDNPVDWYPWCKEAFERAKKEDKPIFLSIGYSACHWCHVIAHESFEDPEIADLLNSYFISIKVDKEERPDIDSVYMTFCQAFTGSGGWPTSVFMTPEQKPFFAGTYFPKNSRGGMIGLRDLLIAIHEKWVSDRTPLLEQADSVLHHLNRWEMTAETADTEIVRSAVGIYKKIFDRDHGGFGRAPKFPTPHNLLFLFSYYQRYQDKEVLFMAEETLLQMYRGGLFDHIGFGFCRYSTDKKYLVPHFEKMLYDNALLIPAYCKAYTVTKKPLYLSIAEKTAEYILRDMTSPDGAFYSSQDADSEGEEGKYYLFTPEEIIEVLGEDSGKQFNRRFDITDAGNFEGKNIPNLLKSDPFEDFPERLLAKLDAYRKKRHSLHRDDKHLTAWNSLMIVALCELYQVSQKDRYLKAAQKCDEFIKKHLCKEETLFVSFHAEKPGVSGFLDDYAAYIYAQLALYKATLTCEYLERAKCFCDKVLSEFGDRAGGFYLYSKGHEELILRPKETYDGAIPSGNSLMAYALVRLSLMTDEEKYRIAAQQQLDFLAGQASQHPAGHAMFLTAFLEHTDPPMKVIAVTDRNTDIKDLPLMLPCDAVTVLLPQPTDEYRLKNGKTTYYVCHGHRCLPPSNDLHELR